MSTKDAEETPAAGTPAWWEARQPPAQRWINQFCENWIFALIIAMAIRHFLLIGLGTDGESPKRQGKHDQTAAIYDLVSDPDQI